MKRAIPAIVPAVILLTCCRGSHSAVAASPQFQPAQRKSAPAARPETPVKSLAEPSPVSSNVVPEPVARYAETLDRFMNGKESSLESVFASGRAAADWLQTPDVPGKASFLESHDSPELSAVLKQMRGFMHTGEGGQLMLPDFKFFRSLSEEKGRVVDREFFILMDASRPDTFPAYVQQITDDQGCTEYGTGTLTTLYGRWQAFRQKFPSDYRAEVRKQVEQIQSEFTENSCACGEQESVVKEFETLLNLNPDDANASAWRNRLADIRNGRAKFRYSCRPS